MELKYTENQRMIADMVRDFGAKHIKPKMMEWDESQEFPVEVFKKLGELGLMGVLVPTKYGGSGFGYLFCNSETKNRNRNTCRNWQLPSGLAPGA